MKMSNFWALYSLIPRFAIAYAGTAKRCVVTMRPEDAYQEVVSASSAERLSVPGTE